MTQAEIFNNFFSKRSFLGADMKPSGELESTVIIQKLWNGKVAIYNNNSYSKNSGYKVFDSVDKLVDSFEVSTAWNYTTREKVFPIE